MSREITACGRIFGMNTTGQAIYERDPITGAIHPFLPNEPYNAATMHAKAEAEALFRRRTPDAPRRT